MKKLYILGFGCGDKGEVTLRTLDTLKKSDKVFVRTVVHPSASILSEYDIAYESFDELYEKSESFEAVYEGICNRVLNCDAETVSYIVPGSAVMAEKSVMLLLQKADCEVQVVPSVSFLDGIFADMKIDAADSFKLIDALSLETQTPDTSCLNIICQIYDKDIASEVKLKLSEYYNEETDVYMISGSATNAGRIRKIKLYEIDRLKDIDHLTTLVVPAQSYMESLGNFYSFEKIIAQLRSENGCPWDKEQTHESLRPYVVEEAYEVVSAINKKDTDNLIEELGDLLLQIVLHAQIAKEDYEFEISDVIRAASTKMIHRHPHVFTDAKLPDDFYKFWDEIKSEEHNYNTTAEEMRDIAEALPALTYSRKLQNKAAKVNFDFKDSQEALENIYSELDELKKAMVENKTDEILDEGGDVLFSAVNVLRLMGIDSEQALRHSAHKFLDRFEHMERNINLAGKMIKKMNIAELNEFWQMTKKEINK